MEKSLIKALKNVTENVFGMANVPQRVYKLPIPQEVKFNILQPGDKKLSHAPRVKVFCKDPNTGPNFSISLVEEPSVVAGDIFLSSRDLKLVLDHIKKYHEAYLKLWNNAGMDVDDLEAEMAKVQ